MYTDSSEPVVYDVLVHFTRLVDSGAAIGSKDSAPSSLVVDLTVFIHRRSLGAGTFSWRIFVQTRHWRAIKFEK